MLFTNCGFVHPLNVDLLVCFLLSYHWLFCMLDRYIILFSFVKATCTHENIYGLNVSFVFVCISLLSVDNNIYRLTTDQKSQHTLSTRNQNAWLIAGFSPKSSIIFSIVVLQPIQTDEY